MTSDWHRAEELFQEAFLAVWQDRGRYQHPRLFRPWLFGIAANKCRAEFRKAPGLPEPLPDGLDRRPRATVAGRGRHRRRNGDAGGPGGGDLAAEAAGRAGAAFVERLGIRRDRPALERTESTIRSEMFHALAGMRRIFEPRMRRTGEDCHDQA